MSFVTAQPEMLMTAAGALAGLNSALSAHNAAAAGPTTGWLAPAADEVSEQTAAQLVGYAQSYQAASAQAAAAHQQIVALLNSNANSYADTEAANAITASLGGV